jgi:CRISPR-associated protein Cas1
MTTICVVEPQTELKIQSSQLQIFHQQKFCFAVPINHVNQLILLGQQPWARKALNLALSLHIPVVYFAPDGQCIEYLNPPTFDSAKYLKYQLQRSQDLEFTRSTAEGLVRAKLHNARVLLLRLDAQPGHATVQQVLNLLQRLLDDLPLAPSLADLITYESTGSSFYRAALSRLLPDAFRYQNLGINPIARLTNLGNALLSQRIQTVLQTLGLDLEVANLHLNALDRPPLVCDFLTELQVPIVDSVVMNLLQTSQIAPEDFIWLEQGIFLRPTALEVFIQSWDAQLLAPVQHLYMGQTTYHHCLEIQAQDYIACLLDEQAFYRPMLLKL